MSDWRPFEPSKDEYERVRLEREANTCNRHDDCVAATRKYIETYRRVPGFGFHCHDDDCEDCFGC